LRDARLPGTAIAVAECHGTGTALGDPIEVGALTEVIDSSNFVPPRILGTLKTNWAHTESSAGIVGLIKCLLLLEHSSGPANLHLRRLNKHIDLPSHSSIGLPTEAY
jgi:acyl transferase domain-containing protein